MRTNVPTWQQYFIDLCKVTATKSKDPSTQCGCVIVDDQNRILGMGFNGPPANINDENVPWEERDTSKSCKYDFIMHAEENAIYDALSKSNSNVLKGSKLFCTHLPCISCTLRCITVGIHEVYWPESASDYPSGRGMEERIRKLIRSQKLINGQTVFQKIKGL